MKKRKLIIGGGLAGILVLVCALALIGTGGIASAKSAATNTLMPAVKDAGGVIADGKVIPQTGAELAFAAGGIVAEVRAEDGRAVKAGEVLARLAGYETAELEAAAAEQDLLAAQQALEEVKRTGPVLAAQAALDEQTTRENKEVAESNGWDDSTYEITRAKYALLVAKWEAALAKLGQYPDGVAAGEINLAEARVASAEKRLAAAVAGMRAMELRSPVAGTVVYLDLHPGQVASPGAIVAAVADLSAWRVKTVDLNETDVTKVKIGDKAILTFDAIPGLEITGKVAAVSAYGQNRLGETVYTVTVVLEKTDARLRWNMTAMVKIQPE
ncbi:MAG: efflux RND transporter periplasmic adaptor subunit [Anaerolineales bacterium]|nr:efflux RND transporter periplasmic adaptor subunit [Anaerolineales bacterium]